MLMRWRADQLKHKKKYIVDVVVLLSYFNTNRTGNNINNAQALTWWSTETYSNYLSLSSFVAFLSIKDQKKDDDQESMTRTSVYRFFLKDHIITVTDHDSNKASHYPTTKTKTKTKSKSKSKSKSKTTTTKASIYNSRTRNTIQYNTIHHEYTGTVLILTFSWYEFKCSLSCM
jgi:hypothetical protein